MLNHLGNLGGVTAINYKRQSILQIEHAILHAWWIFYPAMSDCMSFQPLTLEVSEFGAVDGLQEALEVQMACDVWNFENFHQQNLLTWGICIYRLFSTVISIYKYTDEYIQIYD